MPQQRDCNVDATLEAIRVLQRTDAGIPSQDGAAWKIVRNAKAHLERDLYEYLTGRQK